MYVPGCMTPTEMIKAEGLGAELVKVFPGDLLGPGYIKAIQPIFPQLKFMVTGGVEPERKNLKDWFDAGVVAVGMGSKLITKGALETAAYAKITATTTEALKLIEAARK